jgi:hypothetical protein
MNLAVLLLSVWDEPRITTLTREWMHRAVDHVADYFRDQSGGRESLQFRVFDWFELPMSSAGWNSLGFDAGANVKPLVEAGLNVDLSSFEHFVLVIDKSDARLAALAPDGRHIHLGAQDFDPALLAHELGHIYGAGHANLDLPTGLVEYGDNFCVMGREGAKFSFSHGPLAFVDVVSGVLQTQFSDSGPGMVGPTLLACGWLDLEVPGVGVDIGHRLGALQTTEVELAPLRGAPVPNHQGPPLFVWHDHLTAGQRLLIEYRVPSGWDEAIPHPDVEGSGWIVVHLASGSGPGASSLQLGAIPGTPGTTRDFWKGMVRVTVTAVDIDRGTTILRIARIPTPPPPPPPNPCRDMRRMFGFQVRHLAELNRQLSQASSPEEQAALQVEIEITLAQMDALRADYQSFGCSGSIG